MLERAQRRELPAGFRPGTGYSPELESLRGWAAALVFVFHASAILTLGARHVLGQWVSLPEAFVYGGHTGVSLFFVLSAFLLSRPFFLAPGPPARGVIGRFFRRRALRILPLYWLAVAVGAAATADRLADLSRGLPYLVFLNSLPQVGAKMHPYNAVWWSLATEAQFYLLLPLAFAIARRSRAAGLVLAIASVSLYVSWIAGALPIVSPAARLSATLSILGRGPVLALGVVLAWLDARHGPAIAAYFRRSRVWRLIGGDALILAALVALGALLRPVVRDSFFYHEAVRPAWHAGEGLCWALVVAASLWTPLRAHRVISNRALERLGLLSYSVYMWHHPVLYAVTHALHPWLRAADVPGFITIPALGAVAFAVTLVISEVSYRFVERPFLVRKARL